MESLELVPGVLGTPAQIALELRAARLFSFPSYQAAGRELRDMVMRTPQIECFAGDSTWEAAMRELAFAFLIRNLNADPLAPHVLWDQNPPHVTHGVAVPGSRCTGNNPDTIYRRIPVDPASRYVLHGRRPVSEASDVTLSVLPSVAAQETWAQTTLCASEMDTQDDGHFTVTVDADESRGRRNHIRLAPGAVRLTVRESMIDWATETPWELAVERVGEARASAESDDEGFAARLAARLPTFAGYWIDFAQRTYWSIPPNLLLAPATRPAGLATQLSSLGNFDLREAEALMIRVERLDASYCAFQVLDPWLFGLEYRCRLGSLNHGQAIADPDGGMTLVVSAHDPGVHNWIDTGGILKGTMHIRWQGLSAKPQPLSRAIHVRRMRLDEVAELGLPSVSTAERRQQVEDRRVAHDRRFSIAPELLGAAQA